MQKQTALGRNPAEQKRTGIPSDRHEAISLRQDGGETRLHFLRRGGITKFRREACDLRRIIGAGGTDEERSTHKPGALPAGRS